MTNGKAYCYHVEVKASLWERYWSKVAQSPDGCWLWQGALDRNGYARTYVNGAKRLVHRISYRWFIGPIPGWLTVEHLCCTRCCVNPNHLEAIPLKENILRGNGWGAKHARKTHCPQGHPYSGDNLYLAHNRRYCRTCRRMRDRQHSRSVA